MADGDGSPSASPWPSGPIPATLASGLPEGRREYLLYMPLYNGVSSVEIGIPADRTIARPAPRAEDRRKPIVFYGTSITQGGCASRPGMVHTAILGRRLDRPVINLGFSGNGVMEPEIATLLAELDPAVYVLDCLPNMTAAQVEQRVEPFVRTLRKAHPSTPIVLAEDRTVQQRLVGHRAAAAQFHQPRGPQGCLRSPAGVGCQGPDLPARRSPARRRRRGDRGRIASDRPRFSPDGRRFRRGPGTRVA